MTKTKKRLEYLRGELRAERISYGEISELQSLAPHIAKDDVELLEAAGVPEHPTQDKATARPWQTYNETCVSSCGAFPRFVAQTMLDDEDTKLMSQKEVAAEQQRAEADAALIVRAVNEHSALLAVADSLKVIMLDPKIQAWLAVNDPQASMQAGKSLATLAAVRKEAV